MNPNLLKTIKKTYENTRVNPCSELCPFFENKGGFLVLKMEEGQYDFISMFDEELVTVVNDTIFFKYFNKFNEYDMMMVL